MMITEVRAFLWEKCPVSWSKPLMGGLQETSAEEFRDLVESGMIPAVM